MEQIAGAANNRQLNPSFPHTMVWRMSEEDYYLNKGMEEREEVELEIYEENDATSKYV